MCYNARQFDILCWHCGGRPAVAALRGGKSQYSFHGERGSPLQTFREGYVMTVIKRNGTEVPFDITKITEAVRKANETVEEKNRMTPT